MGLKPLVPLIPTNIKNSPTPSQININPYSKELFTSVFMT